MRTITVNNNVSLDGVMQAPMSPDEDTRGGFPYGGWALAGNDEALAAEMGVGMDSGGALLFGHRTYRHMEAFWPHQTDGNPYTEYMNRVEKFVTSRHPDTHLDWQHSTLLAGEASDTVAELKQTDGPDLTILGSGELVRSLAAAGLVDAYVLIVHPVVLGSGIRMFGDTHQQLELTRSITTPKGVTVAHYRPV
ncbi:dihydrofolate reductase family protein [Agromyces sp. Soil535]|uniref:dihydrofolate reductase family protein n=1 Tax=Agromyces sp. Soil535 TaxID=1736390 RepID=UPI0006FD39B2|nr:dihydrofolate reductase family protein [Agromyces sp. Soil535]KRE21820.1 deaminase [Agromyces sp. Soil535]